MNILYKGWTPILNDQSTILRALSTKHIDNLLKSQNTIKKRQVSDASDVMDNPEQKFHYNEFHRLLKNV